MTWVRTEPQCKYNNYENFLRVLWLICLMFWKQRKAGLPTLLEKNGEKKADTKKNI